MFTIILMHILFKVGMACFVLYLLIWVFNSISWYQNPTTTTSTTTECVGGVTKQTVQTISTGNGLLSSTTRTSYTNDGCKESAGTYESKEVK